MTARTVIAWLVAAVLGLALAAGITLAASQLSSQRVGLSGEPLSAGDRLVPRAQPRPTQRRPSRPAHPSRPSQSSQSSQPSQSSQSPQPSQSSSPASRDDAGDAGGDD
jgi:hypothetical protein